MRRYAFAQTPQSARPAALLILVALVALSGSGRAQSKTPQAKPGIAGPAVIDLRGYQQLLEKHRGKPVLVNFWATWCEPCRDEYPMVKELSRAYAPQGLTVLAVSLDEDSEIKQVREFLARMNPAFSNYRKKPGQDEAFINGVDAKWSGALPANFFYDREGRLVRSLVGEHARPEFDKLIQQLLQGSSPAAAGAARKPAP